MDIKSVKPTFAQDANTALNKGSGSFGSPSLMEQFVIRTMNNDLKKVSAQPTSGLTGIEVALPPARSTAPHVATQSESDETAPARDMKTAPTAIAPQPPPADKKEAEKKKAAEAAAKKKTEKLIQEQNQAEQKKQEAAAKEAKIKLAQEQKQAKETAEKAAKEARLAAKQKSIQTKQAQQLQFRRFLEQAALKLAAKEFDLAIAEAQKIIDNEQAGWFAKWRAERLINKAQKQRRNKNQAEQKKQEAAAKEDKIKLAQEQKQRQDEIASAKPIIKMPLPTINATAIHNKTDMAAEPASIKPTEPPIFTPKPGAPVAVAPLNLPTIEEAPIKIAESPTAPKIEQKPVAPSDERSEFYGVEPRGEDLSEKPIATWPKEPQKINEPMLAVPAPARPITASIPLPAGIKLDKSEKIDESAVAEAEFDIKKILLFGFGSLAVLALVIGGLWYFSKQPANNIAQITQSPSPKPSATAPALVIAPAPLFITDSRKIFELKPGQEKANFQEAMAQVAQTDEPAGNFVYILFQDTIGNWPSLDKLASSTATDIFDLPTQSNASALKDQLNMNSFSFFAYSQSQNGVGDSPFNGSPTTSGRMGLVVKINSASVDQLAKSLKDLEQLMLPGLKIMIPAIKETPANPAFSTNVYKNINIRYVNLPAPDLSFDYAVLNDKLIFATSKVSMYAIIDRILNSSNSFNQPAAPPEIP